VDLILLEMPLWSVDLIERFHYLGPAMILLLCGVGLPLPEEVTLIASGLMVHQGKVEFLPITLVCAAAILAGDSLPYFLGRRIGPRALEHRWVSKLLHPERFAIVEEKFKRHGSLVVFFSRFLPGIRIPAYFTAGTLGMGYLRFLALDGLGVLISVPSSIWLAEQFGGQVESMKEFENFHILLAFALVTVLSVGLFRMVIRRRERQVQALELDGEEDAKGPQ
jgi:membrane protein DedA with SNARE-associated domain